MRLCFYHAEAEWSGRARAFVDAAGALSARGHDVVFACAREGSASQTARERQVDTISWQGDGGLLSSAWRLRSVLRRHLADVVFVHSEREQLEAALAVRLVGLGAVVRRVPPLEPLTMGRAARLAGRLKPTGFLFALEHDLRGATPPARALEAAVAPPAITSVSAAPPGEPDARRIVLVLDAMRRRTALAALGGVALVAERHPELQASLVGPGSQGDELRIQVAALRLSAAVRIVESTAGYEAAPRACASAELALVLADHDEGAFAVLDCYSAGVPVVADRTSLTSALVADGQSGVLTRSLDAEGYAAVIAGLLGDDAFRSMLARGARAAADRWPLAAMADGFERAAAAARDRSPWRV